MSWQHNSRNDRNGFRDKNDNRKSVARRRFDVNHINKWLMANLVKLNCFFFTDRAKHLAPVVTVYVGVLTWGQLRLNSLALLWFRQHRSPTACIATDETKGPAAAHNWQLYERFCAWGGNSSLPKLNNCVWQSRQSLRYLHLGYFRRKSVENQRRILCRTIFR